MENEKVIGRISMSGFSNDSKEVESFTPINYRYKDRYVVEPKAQEILKNLSEVLTSHGFEVISENVDGVTKVVEKPKAKRGRKPKIKNEKQI